MNAIDPWVGSEEEELKSFQDANGDFWKEMALL